MDAKLRKCACDDVFACRKLGRRRATLFKQRLDDLRAANSLEDVRYLPGHYHELTGDRKGQWACNLDHPYRLIFTPHDFSLDENVSGQSHWCYITEVEILEIVDYH